MEMLFAIAIFAMVATSLTSLIYLGIQIIRDDQARLDALAMAESQIETLRNVPYESVGTAGGVPSGPFEQLSTITRNNKIFTIETDIRYVDDPFDDVAPTDLVNTDYKKVRVEVTWEGQYLQDPVVILTNIVPNGIESTSGGGTLWVEVRDAAAEPVVGAEVSIINPDVLPTVNISSFTDINGRFILPGATPGTQSYQITTTKGGFSTAQTYDVDLVANPNPSPGHQTVLAGEVTLITLFIDQLSTVDFHLQEFGTANTIIDLPIQVTGNNRIGTDLSGQDIPEYQQTHTSDSQGNIALAAMEYDTYTIEIDEASGFDFAGSAPRNPFVLPPDASEAVVVEVAPAAPYTLLVTAVNENNDPVASAVVHLTNASQSIDLSQSTNTAGQTFFTPLAAEDFTVEVTAVGFNPYTGSVTVASDEQQTLPLVTTP